MRIFIGYDRREIVAYNVLSYSIVTQSSRPVSITPLVLPQLEHLLHREREPLQSTDFSFSRFLVPYLCGYEGWSLFMDCDMLLLDDIQKLWQMRDEEKAIMVVKHDYTPKDEIKFLGLTQTKYPKKNWSSLILFNNAKCRVLTPEYVNKASGLELHQFKWLESEEQIGGLPREWNFLVDEYSPGHTPPSLLHYTIGGPYFKEYRNCTYADRWMQMLRQMLDCNGETVLP